jgi:hypothetical protein
MGFVKDLLFGKKPSVSYPNPANQIEPEPDYEAELRKILTGNAGDALNYGNQYQTMNFGLLSSLPKLLGKTAMSYDNLMAGHLPTEFQTNFENGIRSGVQTTVGNIANNLVNRGVGLNGTSFTNNLNSVNQAVADASAKNFSGNIGLLSGIAGQGLDSYMNAANTMGNAVNNTYQYPYNLYSLWRQSRYNNRAEPVVDQGSPGLFGSWLAGGAPTF